MANSNQYNIHPNIIFENIDGEVIMINLKIGQYYSLHGIAAKIWSALESKIELQSAINAIANHYQQDPAQTASQVEAFIKALSEAELIVPADDASSMSSNCEDLLKEMPKAFDEPKLESYSDMEQLLMIDPIHDVDDEGWPHRPANTEQ